MTEIAKYNGMMSYLTRPPAPKTQVADLVDDLEPGPLKDELKEKFDPSQETYEEYLQRKALGERPFNASNGGSPKEEIVEPPKSMQMDTTTSNPIPEYNINDFRNDAEIFVLASHNNTLPRADIVDKLNSLAQKGVDAGTFTMQDAGDMVRRLMGEVKDRAQKQRLRDVIIEGTGTVERENKAIGGGVIEGEDLGTREGFRKPTSVQKMSVSDALEEIFDLGKGGTPNTKFRDREELKKLVEEKIGTKINKNILKASRYPILNYAEYDTANLMKEKMAANKKAGKLSKKESTAQAQIKKQNRINLFKANLGVDIEIGPNNEIIGLDEELDKRLRNASKRFRENKLNTEGVSAFDDPNFFKYFDTEYQTAGERLEATAKKYGYTLDEWNELDETQKKRIYAQEFQQKIRINRGEVPGGLSVDEIVDQAYEGKKIPGQGPASKTLDTVYETLFRQEYDKLAEGGDPFSKADLSRNVIGRIKEMFGRPGQDVPLSLFPANTDQLTDSSAKSYYQYIDPKTQRGSKKNKIFSDYELELFDGNTAASLNKTKTQEKIFDIITKGPVEIDELSKQLEMTPNNVRSEINRLLTNAIVRVNKPVFLKGKEDLISTLVNNLEATKTLDGEWNRSLKYLIYSQIPDPVARNQAFDKVDQFDSILKIIQEKFPGIQVNYDHPAGYAALKNLNFKEFLNITPIAQDINNLKSRFDTQSNKNLLAMEEAKGAGNMLEYNRLLDRQTRLENTWSTLTGGQSSLGKIRLEGVEDFGTIGLDDPNKDLFREFRDNISIRQNIAKNLSPDIKTELEDLLERKDRKTKIVSTIEKVTDPDLIKQDRQIQKFFTAFKEFYDNPKVQSALKKSGTGIEGLRGVGQLRKGNIPGAINTFKRILQENPDLRVELGDEFSDIENQYASLNMEGDFRDFVAREEEKKKDPLPYEAALPAGVVLGKYGPQILNALKGVGKVGVKTVGSLPAAGTFAGMTIKENLDEGKNIADAVVDPLVGIELLLPETVKKLGPLMARAARVSTPVGVALTGVGALKERALGMMRDADTLTKTPYQEDLIDEYAAKQYRGYELGGRVGFADGPEDPSKRKFMKIMGGLASLPIVGRFFKIGEKAAPVIDAVKTEAAKGKPEWFDALVNKVIRMGEDVTEKFATKDREIVNQIDIADGETVRVYRDIDEGAIRVEYESPDNVYGDPVQLQYKKPLPDEGDPNPSAEFDVAESGPVGRAFGPDDYEIEIDEIGGTDIKDLSSDVSKLKEFATGQKPTMKEIVQNKKRKDKAKAISEGGEDEMQAVIDRQGEFIQFDDINPDPID